MAANRKIEEADRFKYPDEWVAQQNATTVERGYGPEAPEQRPPLPRGVDPQALKGLGLTDEELGDPALRTAIIGVLQGGRPWTMPNPRPADEEGPHLKDRKNAVLREAALQHFERAQGSLADRYMKAHQAPDAGEGEAE